MHLFQPGHQPSSVLTVDLEEVIVLKLIPNALHAVKHGLTRIVQLSNDTDVMVLTLHYWDTLKGHGLQEFLMQVGVGNNRYVPLHILAERLGHKFCSTMTALHHLTRCDSTSEFGGKSSALKSKAAHYLHNFGKDPNNINLEMAKEFLVNVYKPGTKCKTLVEFRGKGVFDQVVVTPFHHNGLKSYTNYRVSVQTKSGKGDSDPVVIPIRTLPRIPVPPNVTYEENRDVATFRWRTPGDAQGVIWYNYSYEVKPIACDRETDSQSNSTTDTEVSFSKPSHYANVTFLLAIGNEAGFSEPGKLTFTSSSKVPEVEVKEIQCENNTRPSYCLVTLEDNCTKVNGKDLDIDIELEYTTNSAKNPMTSSKKNRKLQACE
ncbi:uncharacterized protein LOC135215330 [Macrobrachium nipponense]|uniref:uncharacterized protein LOC135215330 n=1 Tax=Macrobrachium nipponense TaxID=159736 RepID=UPI0030C880D1